MKHLLLSTTRLFGIDVSHFQGTIDWTKVKNSKKKVYFAYMKATEGGDLVDDQYANNMKGAISADIPAGPYHFFRPKTAVDLQVQNFVKTVGKLQPGNLPPMLDLEVPSQWLSLEERNAHIADWMSLTVTQRVTLVTTWMDAVEKQLGVTPIIYMSPSFATSVLGNAPELKKYKLYIAQYTTDANPTVPAPWTDFLFWQTSEHGTADGISGAEVDLDLFNGTVDQLNAILVPGTRWHIRLRHRVTGWFSSVLKSVGLA